MMLEPAVRQFRSRGYAMLAGWPSLMMGSFWPVILAQAALTAGLIQATLRLVLPALGAAGRALAGAAVALTTAPWAASYVMPDALTAPGALALVLLVSGRAGWRLAVPAGAVVVMSCASHVTHALVLGSALAGVLALRLVPLRRTAIGLVCIGLGYGSVLVANRVHTGHAEYVRGGEVFLAARFAGDGLLQRYLAQECPDARLPMLCAAREVLPRNADDFLWLGDSPLRPAGDLYAASAEFRIANRAVMAELWPEWLAAALPRAATQLLMVQAGDGLEQALMEAVVERIAATLGEPAAAHHAASRQACVEMADDLLAWAMAPAGLMGLVLAPLMLLRVRDPVLRLLLAIACLACVANALAVGFGGSEHARYTARIVWLLPFGAMVALLHPRFGAVTEGTRLRPDGRISPSESGLGATDARFPRVFARCATKTSCFPTFSDARHSQRRPRRGNHPGRPSGDHP